MMRKFSATRMRALLATAAVVVLGTASMRPQNATSGGTSAANQSGLPGATVQRLWGQPEVSQNQGYAAFYQDLAKLRSTARLMATAAHPDDEDGPMLAQQARGAGATALELTINRGEGGQNKLGQELFDELGILRTLELLQSDQYYGVEERFTRVADFGFSKSAEETFTQWHGHDTALGDMVRVIRTFRPDVMVSVFSGTPSDGHGHHQASGILTREAFRAAAAPDRFPEQIQAGLLPWQAKKLYIGRFARTGDCSVQLDVGQYSAVLGKSYAELGVEGRGHQLTQVSSPIIAPGHRLGCYVLVDSVLPAQAGAKEAGAKEPTVKEKDLFDGIDTSLPGLAARLGAEETKAPFLAAALDQLDGIARKAAASGPDQISQAVPLLLEGAGVLRRIIPQVQQSAVSGAAKAELLTHLETKLAQFEKAATDAAGIEIIATADVPSGQGQGNAFFNLAQGFLMAVPGQTFTLTAHLYNRGNQQLDGVHMELELPAGWKAEKITSSPASSLSPGAIASNTEAAAQFRVTVPADAEYTRPYFYRDDPPVEGVYHIIPSMERYVTLPFPPPPVLVRAEYKMGDFTGEARSVAQVRYVDPLYGQAERPLAVGPPLSLELEPEAQVISTAKATSTQVRVGVRNNVIGGAEGTLRLEAPAGWRVQPPSLPVRFSENNEYNSYAFTVTPGGGTSTLQEKRYSVKAVLDYNGKQYSDGYRVVTRHDLGTFYYYRPARQQVNAVSVALPPRLRVGYIMGAGDDIEPVLKQLGLDVTEISPQELGAGDLSRYDTVVLGIRAYDVRTDVRQYNKRLLDYVQRGGTLVVQYNQQTGQFNAGHYTPFPLTLSGERVTVEEAPVQVLAPAERVFNWPNKIVAHDFDGWVQERGLYFARDWDSHYQPLLACSDPGEAPLKGGLLVAPYGSGKYVYTGYAFFRQLPAGVPGAARLFVNLLSLGAKTGRTSP